MSKSSTGSISHRIDRLPYAAVPSEQPEKDFDFVTINTELDPRSTDSYSVSCQKCFNEFKSARERVSRAASDFRSSQADHALCHMVSVLRGQEPGLCPEEASALAKREAAFSNSTDVLIGAYLQHPNADTPPCPPTEASSGGTPSFDGVH